MKLWTLKEITDKIRRDLDLEAEVFVRPEELLDYVNEAIDICESEIHTLYEDYFLSESTISLVHGQAEYDLPANIYAQKIRQIVYDNGGTVYQVPRLTTKDYLEVERLSNRFSSTDFYHYYLINSNEGVAPLLRLVPASREDAPNILIIHYIRNANRLQIETDVCDIPEFVYFVIQYIKTRIYEKEMSPNYPLASQKLEKLEQRMRDTLMNRVPDGNTHMELDTSFYEEMS